MVVREVTEHTSFDLKHVLTVDTFVRYKAASLVDGAEELVAECYLIVETAETFVEPVVVT